MILAGDVGGTKTALALFEERDGQLHAAREATLPSGNRATFEELIHDFLEGARRRPITAACFGVAGPVIEGRCATTNLPWTLDERQLAHDIPAARVKLLNDLEATGYGVVDLPRKFLTTLQEGTPRPGNMALIAAGTGLGEALLVWDGTRHLAIASEGGHTDFAPRTDLELDLLRFLAKEFGRVSYERVLSGPGLHNIYRFLRDSSPVSEPAWLTAKLESGDASAAISAVGLAGGDPFCVQALDLFVSIYGAEAGNLALKALAVGGVFVGGGIAPKIHAKLASGIFTEAFRDKGRLSALMASIPIHVVLEPRTALIGAASVARELSR